MDKGDDRHEQGLTTGNITEARRPHVTVAQRIGLSCNFNKYTRHKQWEDYQLYL